MPRGTKTWLLPNTNPASKMPMTSREMPPQGQGGAHVECLLLGVNASDNGYVPVLVAWAEATAFRDGGDSHLPMAVDPQLPRNRSQAGDDRHGVLKGVVHLPDIQVSFNGPDPRDVQDLVDYINAQRLNAAPHARGASGSHLYQGFDGLLESRSGVTGAVGRLGHSNEHADAESEQYCHKGCPRFSPVEISKAS